MSGKVKYWDCEESERLTHTELGDAIGEFLGARLVHEWPDTIEARGFVQVTVTATDLSSPLEDMLERLDDDYGDPDEYSKPTEAMRAAERVFLEAIASEYEPWLCVQVATETIDVREWVALNEPDALAEFDATRARFRGDMSDGVPEPVEGGA